jgi:hypothetical protein
MSVEMKLAESEEQDMIYKIIEFQNRGIYKLPKTLNHLKSKSGVQN